ncbi:MAG: DUF4344 domain-containing metallopeptidase [Elusimicrobiota bacterium]
MKLVRLLAAALLSISFLASRAVPSRAQEVVPPAAPAPDAPAPSSGTISVRYEPTKKKELKRFEALARKTGVFEDNARMLSEQFVLPRDLDIVFKDCDEANAFYSYENHSITMCYEMLEESAKLFRGVAKPASAVDSAVLYSTIWTLYHEMGHALISLLDIPATGKEEDAVDQFSTLVLLQSGEQEADAVAIAAEEFRLSAAARAKGEEFPFWDVHSMDEQRFYNILCLVYGENPEKESNKTMVEDGDLPQARTEGCEAEYQQFDRAWTRLTDPYLRKKSP